MFLFSSYFVRKILMVLAYFNTTFEEFKVIYRDRSSYYITEIEFHDVPVIFLSNFLKEI